MNSQNVFIGAVIILVLLLGGYLIWNNNFMNPGAGGAATSTPVTGGNATVPPVPATTAGLPGVQTGSLAVPSNTSAVVTGYVAPNGAATTYWYDYGTNSLNNRSTTKSAGSGFVTLATPAFLSGLAANTTYSYRLSAQNSFGTVQGATYTVTTTATAPTGSTPGATTGAASGVARTSATLNGQVDPNGAQTTYWFEYGLTQSFGNATAFGSAGNGSDNLAVGIAASSLTPATKYFYRLNAQNVHGVVSGSVQSFTTLGPAATGLPTVNTTAATNVATSTATLNGRVNPHDAASSYWFEYSTTPIFTNILGTVSATQTLPAQTTTNVSVNVKGLSTNTKYYFRLVARNPQGTAVGDAVSFTTRR